MLDFIKLTGVMMLLALGFEGVSMFIAGLFLEMMPIKPVLGIFYGIGGLMCLVAGAVILKRMIDPKRII